MTRVSLAGRLAAIGLLMAGLTACGAGPNATTSQFYSPADGVGAVVGDIKLLNVLVVAAASGQGGTLSMAVNNMGDTPEQILGVKTAEFGPVVIEGPRLIPPRTTITYGGIAAQGQARIPGFTGKPGQAVSLDMEFARNAPIRNLSTVVLPPTGYYDGVGPTPSPIVSPGPVTPVVPEQTEPGAPAGTGGGNVDADPLAPQDPSQP